MDVFRNIYGGYMSMPQEGRPNFFGSEGVAAAAMRQNNDVVNLLDYLSRPPQEYDPNFNYGQLFDGDTMREEWRPLLALSTSASDFNNRLSRIRGEEMDKATLAASGWTGTVAAMGAGVLSPTIFLPFAGQASGTARMAQILGYAAAGATASEAALFFNQETRTEAEMLGSIAFQTAFAGALGAALDGIPRAASAQSMERLRANMRKVAVPEAEAGMAMAKREVDIERMYDQDGMAIRPTQEAIPTSREPIAPVEIKTLSGPAGEITVNAVRQLPDGRSSIVLTGEGMRADLATTFGDDAAAHALAVQEQVTSALDSGATVYIHPEGKSIEIKTVSNLGLVDANGNPWGVTGLLMETTENLKKPAISIEGTARGADEGFPIGRMSDASRAEAESLSAAAAPSRVINANGVELPDSAFLRTLMDMFGKASPQYRMAANRVSPALRDAAFKLDASGLRQGGLATSQPSAAGGTVVSRVKLSDAAVNELTDSLNLAYHQYLFPDGRVEVGKAAAALEQIKSRLGLQPNGKMDWLSWKETVYDDYSQGIENPDTDLAQSSLRKFFAHYNQMHKDYLAELRGQGLDVAPLYKELDEGSLGEGVQNYAHQAYDADRIAANSAEFIRDIQQHTEQGLKESFAKSQKAMTKRVRQMETELRFASLSASEQAAEFSAMEGRIKALQESEELVAVRDGRKEILRDGEADGLSKEEIKARVDAYDEALPDELKSIEAAYKESLAARRLMRGLNGNALAEIEKARATAAAEDAKLESMFRTEMPAIEKADLSIKRLQKWNDRSIAQTTKKLEKVMGQLSKRMEQYQETFKKSDPVFDRAAERLRVTKEKYDDALARLEMVKGKVGTNEDRLKELAHVRELAVMESARLVKLRGARAVAQEEKAAQLELTLLSPEEHAKLVGEMQTRLDDYKHNWERSWYDKGAVGNDLISGNADFVDAALEHATYFLQRVLRQDASVPSSFLARQSERGPQLLRTFGLDYSVKKKWLVRDVELVGRIFDRVMAPDLELWRAFDGSVNGQGVIDAMGEELHQMQMALNSSTHVILPKGLAKVSKKSGDSGAGWLAKQADLVKNRLTPSSDFSEMVFSPASFMNSSDGGAVALTPELRQTIAGYISAQMRQGKMDFDVAIQRVRNSRMTPKDASSLGWRSGRFLKNLNVSTSMGSVVPASISDFAMPIWRYGIAKVAGNAWLPFISGMKSEAGRSFRVASGEANRRIALNIEAAMHGRAQAMIDLADPGSRGHSFIERVNKTLAEKTGLVALFDFWTDAQKGIAGAATHATLGEYIPQAAAKLEKAMMTGTEVGADAEKMLTYLRELGLRDMDIVNIGRQMAKDGGMEVFPNGGRLPNFDVWDDAAAFRAYGAAVQGDVNRMILTPGLERPNKFDENIAWSLVWQFQSFGAAVNSRLILAGLQGNQPYLMQGIMFSLATGALSYYAWATAVGGKSLDKANEMDLEDWIYQAVDRSGMMGLMSYPWRIAEQVPALNQMAIFGGEDQAYRRPVGLVGALFGPTASKLEKMTELLKTIDQPERQARNLHLMRQLFVPYQNHFLFRRMVDGFEEALTQSVGG